MRRRPQPVGDAGTRRARVNECVVAALDTVEVSICDGDDLGATQRSGGAVGADLRRREERGRRLLELVRVEEDVLAALDVHDFDFLHGAVVVVELDADGDERWIDFAGCAVALCDDGVARGLADCCVEGLDFEVGPVEGGDVAIGRGIDGGLDISVGRYF